MPDYTAAILEGETFVTVDLRDLDGDKLRALRVEAGAAGDGQMIATIDSILADRAVQP